MKLIRLLLILLMATPLNAFAQKGNNRVAHTLELTVKDKDNTTCRVVRLLSLQRDCILRTVKSILRNEEIVFISFSYGCFTG